MFSLVRNNRLMKSGMTLTQIFSKYDSVHEKLLVKEEEFQKLQRSYDQLSQVYFFTKILVNVFF